MVGDYRTPSGWTQEEDALKLAEEEFGDSAARSAAVRQTIERYLIE